ncbi:hypothetical protein FBULB1_13422 [Fusarium bulbicola]|nr:hypothetical protein FBULB1_13422 [Fusarium bulbicola]
MEKFGIDLRDALDVTQNQAQICRKLQSYSIPGAQFDSNNKGLETQGLDCLIMLIRYIYSEMLYVYFDKEKCKDAEERNPLLALAWMSINPDENVAWARAKQYILKQLNSHHEGEPETSFISLVNSPLMKATFWNDEAFILYRACLTRLPDAPWEMADLGQNPAAAMVDMSTIMIDRNQKPNRSFQKFMEAPFKVVKKPTKELLKLCAEPTIIRVHYKTSKDLEPFAFSKLKDIEIPIHYADDIGSSEPLSESQRCLYTLVASVSLQQQRIRTYRFLGEEISTFPFTSRGKRWSLEEKIDGDFMLFYARAGFVLHDPEIPETRTFHSDKRFYTYLNKFFDDRKKEDKKSRD